MFVKICLYSSYLTPKYLEFTRSWTVIIDCLLLLVPVNTGNPWKWHNITKVVFILRLLQMRKRFEEWKTVKNRLFYKVFKNLFKHQNTLNWKSKFIPNCSNSYIFFIRSKKLYNTSAQSLTLLICILVLNLMRSILQKLMYYLKWFIVIYHNYYYFAFTPIFWTYKRNYINIRYL